MCVNVSSRGEEVGAAVARHAKRQPFSAPRSSRQLGESLHVICLLWPLRRRGEGSSQDRSRGGLQPPMSLPVHVCTQHTDSAGKHEPNGRAREHAVYVTVVT